jgi:two-component system chemotaxis response regulator CheB
MNILFIDSDVAFTSKLKNYFDEKGAQVFVSLTIMDALIIVHDKGKPDLIVLEIKPSLESGYAFIRQLQRENPCPIIILSEYGRDEDVNQAYMLGVLDYIHKNVGFDRVVSLIDQNLAIIKYISKLFESKEEQISDLERSPLDYLLKMAQIKNINAEMIFGEDKAKIILIDGKLNSVSMGKISGEAALCYLINRAKGDFVFEKKLGSSQIEKNNFNLYESLHLFRTIKNRFKKTLALIPVKRVKSTDTFTDERKKYFYNLIDNDECVDKIISHEKTESWLAVYYYVLLEKQNIVKLVESDGLPGDLYITEQKNRGAVRVLFVGDPPPGVVQSGDFESSLVVREKEVLSEVIFFDPHVVVWSIESSQQMNMDILKQLMLSNPIPVMLNLINHSQIDNYYVDMLRFGVIDIWYSNKDESGYTGDNKSYIDQVIRIANANKRNLQHIKLKSYKRAQYEYLPFSENIIMMNASLGSYHSLLRIIPHLPGNLKTSVVVLSDVEEKYLEHFVRYLDVISEMKIKIACNEEKLMDGSCYFISKGNLAKFSKNGRSYLLMVEKKSKSGFSEIVDHGMRSAASVYKEQCTGVFLSGFSEDGVAGMGAVKWNHGYTIVQYPGTCIMAEAPLAALKVKAAHEVVDINKISEKLLDHIMSVADII